MRCKKTSRLTGESGYVLLALMLTVTLLLIAMSVAAPRIAQQIKRQKEEELVHRGRDYAMAVKRFVHKNGGRYPASIEQLEDTNHVRFLRKRYKDPMTGEDNWRMVHYGEAQITIPQTTGVPGLNGTTQNPGLGGSTPNTGTAGTSSGIGGGTSFGQNSGSLTGTPNQPASNTFGSTPPTLAGGSQSVAQGQPQPGNTGQLGSLTTTNIGNGQTVGGGQIIGVASVNKGQAIKEFNDKDHYNDWLFVYDLRLEQSGGTGVAVAAPMSASAAAGQSGTAAGTTGTQNPSNGQLGQPGQDGAIAGGGEKGLPAPGAAPTTPK
jgi:type II secretory pathway pseudopilin PulG